LEQQRQDVIRRKDPKGERRQRESIPAVRHARRRPQVHRALQWSQREAVRHRREARRVDARERIDQSAQLDRVRRVYISTIQRLYSMLCSFFFWIETTMPQCAINTRRQACRCAKFAFLATRGSLK
jgi:hypothetical protein